MDVYFDDNVRRHHKNHEKLKENSFMRDFTWGDTKGKIFALYTGKAGVVLDLGIQTELNVVKLFLEKWQTRAESMDLSHEEFEQMEQDNPMCLKFQVSIETDSGKLIFDHSRGLCWYPFSFLEEAQEAGSVDVEAQQLVETYDCDRNYAWSFKRIFFRWSNDNHELFPFALTFHKDKKYYEGRHFITKPGCVEQIEKIINPFSGEEYTLTIYDCEEDEMDYDTLKCDVDQYGMEFPNRFYELTYDMEPGLSHEDFLLKDSHRGDKPNKAVGKISDNKRAASVAVIGGADGPTSIFMAGKIKDKKEKQIQRIKVYSSMYFHKQEEIEWSPVFKVQDKEDMIIRFQRM